MQLCESCAEKQKKEDISDALNAMEDEFSNAKGLCQIMQDLDNPPRYLYERVAEHLEGMERRFYHLWDVVYEKKAQ